jgi:hypothetical protein
MRHEVESRELQYSREDRGHKLLAISLFPVAIVAQALRLDNFLAGLFFFCLKGFCGAESKVLVAINKFIAGHNGFILCVIAFISLTGLLGMVEERQ